MPQPKIFIVGGWLRDRMVGIPNNDLDLMIVGDWETLMTFAYREKFRVVKAEPKHMSARMLVPKTHPWRELSPNGAFDITCCRTDGNKRADAATVLRDPVKDLERRDFTVNAMAQQLFPIGSTGRVLDPFSGRRDLMERKLRFVGDPYLRIYEDPNRVMRGLRFMITHGLTAEQKTLNAIHAVHSAEQLGTVPIENIQRQLALMFEHNPAASMGLLSSLPSWLQEVIFRKELKFQPTLTKRIHKEAGTRSFPPPVTD